MQTTRRTHRSAFSLLEMVLALALAMVLMLALYLTLSTYISSAKGGRETLDEGELARSIMTRIATDAVSHLGSTDTRALPKFVADTNDKGGLAAVNVGVRGDATTLILSTYRIEQPGSLNSTDMEVKSDIRRIHYWVVMNGAETVGLARREFKQATSNDIDADPTQETETDKYLITRDKEIKSVTFEYHNGQDWQGTWDGSIPGTEDGTPTGPPAAIRITLVLRPRAKAGAAGTETTAESDQRLTFVHVVALPGGNNFTPKTQ